MDQLARGRAGLSSPAEMKGAHKSVISINNFLLLVSVSTVVAEGLSHLAFERHQERLERHRTGRMSRR